MVRLYTGKRIRNGKFSKQITSLALAATFAIGGCGCSDNVTKNNDDSQVSICTSFDIDKIDNNGELDEETLTNLFDSFGFIDLNAGYFDLDGLSCFTEEQKEAIAECKEALKPYLESQDKETAKVALDKVLKTIDKFYDGESPVTTIRKILSTFLPEGIHVSNDRFEDKNGEVYSLSYLKHEIVYDDSVDKEALNFYKFYMLMCRGCVADNSTVSGVVYNFNTLLQVCVNNTYKPLQVFKDNNNKTYLGNCYMLGELLFYDQAIDKLNDKGLFKRFSVIDLGNGFLDVQNNGESLYQIDCNYEDDTSNFIKKHLKDGKITSSGLQKDGVIAPVLMKLLSTLYGMDIIMEYIPDEFDADFDDAKQYIKI